MPRTDRASFAPSHGLLVVADSGPGIGLGHLQRCLALASALQREGMACAFVSTGDPRTDARIRRREFACLSPGFRSDLDVPGPDSVLAEAGRAGCQGIVVDSYRVTQRYLEALRTAGLFVAAVDDLAAYPFPCHLVINGGAHATRLVYRSSTGDTRFLLGPQFALMQPEFGGLSPHHDNIDVRTVLVTLGGADRGDLTPALLAALDEISGDFAITAVLGPLAENGPHVHAVAARCRHPVHVVEAPESMCELMRTADIAVSAGGQTLYELAAAGTPAVAVITAANQSAGARALEASGAAIMAGPALRPDAQRVRQAVELLMADGARRRMMSRAGQQLIDGQGTHRVAKVLRTLLPQRVAGS